MQGSKSDNRLLLCPGHHGDVPSTVWRWSTEQLRLSFPRSSFISTSSNCISTCESMKDNTCRIDSWGSSVFFSTEFDRNNNQRWRAFYWVSGVLHWIQQKSVKQRLFRLLRNWTRGARARKRISACSSYNKWTDKQRMKNMLASKCSKTYPYKIELI